MRKLSQNGLNLLKGFEGLSLTAYQCDAGVWTIGYGCTSTLDGYEVKKGDKLASRRVAEVLLQKKLESFEKAVNQYVNVPLNQNQYDALCLLCFNIGVRAFRHSTLVSLLNRKEYAQARLQFYRWKFVNGEINEGLRLRRIKEANLFIKP